MAISLAALLMKTWLLAETLASALSLSSQSKRIPSNPQCNSVLERPKFRKYIRVIRKVIFFCFTPYLLCFRPPIPSSSGIRKVRKFYKI
jgi:hypothetical protein